ncbi:hypothetical protein BV898_03583 [Hypsibius exemplaris]|uniref:Uncharacterized protein n=1 Tax=Hypsibius exemplaris TaxID=2072580 RepID=A0A1W0X4J3_HYPEX|nr:hypothetical protein BV898_03583 [Hypsibius exemplaris]
MQHNAPPVACQARGGRSCSSNASWSGGFPAKVGALPGQAANRWARRFPQGWRCGQPRNRWRAGFPQGGAAGQASGHGGGRSDVLHHARPSHADRQPSRGLVARLSPSGQPPAGSFGSSPTTATPRFQQQNFCSRSSSFTSGAAQ